MLPAVTRDFAEVVMDVVDPAVEEAEQNLPRLGADGRIEFDPAALRCGRLLLRPRSATT